MAKRKPTQRRYETVGTYLRAKRMELGLSQREVCRALKINTSQCVSNLERGLALPPLPRLRVIIAKYGVTYQQVVNLILEDEKRRLQQTLR